MDRLAKDERTHSRAHVILLILGLIAGCGQPAADDTGDQTTDDAAVTQTVGSSGGTVAGGDGKVAVMFPADALALDTRVSVEVREPTAVEGSPKIVSEVVDVALDPAPEDALPVLSVVTFEDVTGDADTLRIGRFTEPAGDVTVIDGPSDASASFWRPLDKTLFDDGGHPMIEVPRFSRYCVLANTPPASAPTAQQLTPPEAPPGFVYAGADVVVDNVYSEQHSTLPLDWTTSPDDRLLVRSRTAVADGVTTSDVIVVHHFVPAAQADRDCPVPEDWLVPPPTPEGYRYVGRSVVVNFVLVDTTEPLTRALKETDLTSIRSETVVVDGVLKCDIIVSHTFEQIEGDDTGGGDDTDGGDDTGGDDDGSDTATPGTAVVGPDGGTVMSSAGLTEVVIPAGILGADTNVTVRDLDLDDELSSTAPFEALFGSVDVLAAFQIDFDPPLAAVPDFGMGISSTVGGSALFAVAVEQPGQITVLSGDADAFPKYFRPLAYTRPDDKGDAAFYTPLEDALFAVVRAASGCQPSQAALTPPAAPAGHRYMGRMVVVNGVYREELSTLDIDRGPAATDQLFVHSESEVNDGQICDIIVAHVFEPQQNDQRCQVPPEMLVPPATPPGHRYVGYDVVVNFVLVDSTVDLTREDRATDLHFIRSSTTVQDFVTECDIIVRHLFEPE